MIREDLSNLNLLADAMLNRPAGLESELERLNDFADLVRDECEENDQVILALPGLGVILMDFFIKIQAVNEGRPLDWVLDEQLAVLVAIRATGGEL